LSFSAMTLLVGSSDP